jgi:DNA-binding GntR family transcriptional regulator
LRTLRREGLVEIARAGEAARVAAPNRPVFLSAYEVREMIDGLAARLAATHAGPAIEARCRAALKAQHAAISFDDWPGYIRANVSFHATMLDRSGNRVLREHVSLVRSTSRSAVLLGTGRMRQAVEEHDAILAAVCGREREDAEHAARARARALDDPSPGADLGDPLAVTRTTLRACREKPPLLVYGVLHNYQLQIGSLRGEGEQHE